MRLTPQVISSIILKKMIQFAQQHFKENGIDTEIKDVVITVPSYFGMEQRNATIEAGELAGLNILMIITEPTAAAIPYTVNNNVDSETLFIFDLGGGTFDVTITEVNGKNIKQIASDGSPELGGKDWDDVLLDYCAEKFMEAHPNVSNPTHDTKSYAILYEQVLRAKISLSKKEKARVSLSFEGESESIEITRELFEQLSEGLVNQCASFCRRVLEKTKMAWSDIDKVLLVGGSTKMPMIKNLVREISGKSCDYEVNPDECVAIGAAYQANMRFIEDKVKEEEEKGGVEAAKEIKKQLMGPMTEIDVIETTAMSLGIVVVEDRIYEMIPEQSTIPYDIKDGFAYTRDGQTGVLIQVTEGKGKLKADVVVIGEVILEGLPPKAKGDPLTIRYIYNRNKILEVEAVDEETGKTTKGKVTLSGSLNEADQEKAMKQIADMVIE